MADRGRPRKFDRTEALDRALMAFWRDGFEATSMMGLVEAMQINSPSIYAAFGSKEALYAEAITHYRATYAGGLLQALYEAPNAVSGLAAMFDAAIDLFTYPERPHGCFVVCALGGNAPAATDVQAELARLRRERSSEIAARLETDVANGRLSSDLPIAPLADMYAAILQGMAIAARDGMDRERLRQLYRPSLELVRAA